MAECYAGHLHLDTDVDSPAMIAWVKVILLGVTKLPCKLLAPLAVLFVDRNTHPIWGVRDATDLSWWNIGVRNACHNMYTRPQVQFITKGNTIDPSLEAKDGLQWRYRKSLDGKYVSFRMTWGKQRYKGKREFYIGWTMNKASYMRLTFFQLRVF